MKVRRFNLSIDELITLYLWRRKTYNISFMARTEQTARTRLTFKFPRPPNLPQQEFSLPAEYSNLQATKVAQSNNRRHFGRKSKVMMSYT